MGVTALVVSIAIFFGNGKPFSSPKFEKILTTGVRLARNVEARILVRPGMSEEMVHRILGGECTTFLAPGIPHPFILDWYYNHGAQVFYAWDRHDVLRVERVVFY
jgi:hypothetical protein